ncbi:MAG TPA: hypothetical protein VLI07_17210 [Candidatus Binatus sp.]|nr:hypothetical protein [Candidatus Binatus sp.]
MSHSVNLYLAAMLFGVVLVPAARADRQVIAPGTGPQDSVVVDSGANGICETKAHKDDLQQIPVGQGLPFADEIHCGQDRVAASTAAGDDVQLIGVGSACSPNETVIDTGPDGIANSTAAGDDQQRIGVGMGEPNEACIVTGGNGVADTPLIAGDDLRHLLVGAAEPNSPVVRCGPNRISETTANNFRAGGDDVQLVPVGAPCPNAGTVVVDSGANGIAETQAQGPDLVMLPVPPVHLKIPRRQGSASRRVKVVVQNAEVGNPSAASRVYLLSTDDGSCPNGTISEVDADARMKGIQPTASVARKHRMKASFVVTLRLEDVTSLAKNVPFRCSVTVEADALDTAPDPDDAANPANNSVRVDIEAVDLNDL